MKKIFTFAAALLASLTMFAQTTVANFEVTLDADPTAPYASYEDDDATYACYKIGSGSSSNFFKASDGKYYLKLTGDDAYVQIALKSGSFAADDVVYYALNHSSKKSGIGFKFAKSGATTTVDMTAAGTEVVGQYTLTAADIEDDGSIKMHRTTSNTFVNRIYVVRPQAETNPVTTVTVNGPAKGVKDYASVFTATTDVKADAYQWFVDDVAQNEAIGKSFEFTPAASGDYSIVCKARNANNAEGQWAASDAFAFKVANSLSGEIIKATLTSGTAATVTGIIGGTADVSLSSSKKLDKGKYFGITLASGEFQEGDTVIISMTAKGANYPCLFADKERTTCLYLATETSEDLEYKIVLPQAADGLTSLYLARDANDEVYKWNPILSAMAVVRPMPIKSRVETLNNVKVEGKALTADELNELKNTFSVTLSDSYVTAPAVTFSKTVSIVYEDDSEETIQEDADIIAEEVYGLWEAAATVGDFVYTVRASKASSFTVTYIYNGDTIGIEKVAAGAEPVEYAEYEVIPLCSFDGWYTDAALTNPISLPVAITADITFYAKFTTLYLNGSVNIEQWVLDNGKDDDTFKGLLANANIDYFNIDALDSLNDTKDNRNYAFLGLKLKKADASLSCWLQAGHSIAVKFGSVGADFKVYANGMEQTLTAEGYANTTVESDKVLVMTNAPEDTYLQIVCNTTKTLVVKQIMLDEAVAPVVLPDSPTAIENTEAEIKATKVVRDGQMMILKNGVLYNMQGAVVK